MNTASVPFWLIAVMALALTACSGRDETLPAEVTTAIETAFNRDDPDACAAAFAEGAEILPEGSQTVSGREAIRGWWAEQTARNISYDTSVVQQIVRNDLAVEEGTYRVRDVAAGVDVEVGKYLTVWKRIDHDWKVHLLIYNTNIVRGTAVSVEEEQAAHDQLPAGMMPESH